MCCLDVFMTMFLFSILWGIIMSMTMAFITLGVGHGITKKS